MVTLTWPNSSSRVKKRILCAEAVAAEVDQVVAGREIRDPVLELVGVELIDVGKRGRSAGKTELCLLVDPAAEAFAVPSLLPSPGELAPWLAEGVEGADHDQVADRTGTDRPTTQPAQEIVERPVWTFGVAFLDDRLATLLTQVADIVEADPHRVLARFAASAGKCGIGRVGKGANAGSRGKLSARDRQHFWQAAHIGAIDVDRQRLQPVALHVLDQHARVIEAHRLVVQQTAAELDRVVQLHPRGLV